MALRRSSSKIATLAATEAPSTTEQKQKTSSTSEAEPTPQVKVQDRINRSEYTFFRPIHSHVEPSILSSEAPKSLNFRGFFHLGVIVLVVTHLRLVLENLLKYGILLDFKLSKGSYTIGDVRDWPIVSAFVLLGVFATVAFLLERLAVRRRVSETNLAWFHGVNISLVLVAPSAILQRVSSTGPVAGGSLLFVAVVLVMKLVSYALVNRDYRTAQKKGVQLLDVNDMHLHLPPNPVLYPNNLTIADFIYFLLAPTMCYQLNYPRTPHVRRWWLVGKIAQLVFFCGMIRFIVEQYAMPVVEASREPLEKLNWLRLFERVLKLSLPNLYIWLLCFYSFFHLWLNILAEVLRFGDRVFYKDWWNATTIEDYWRMWNLPVHHWAHAYLYTPLVHKFKLQRLHSAAVVFFVSAVLHELLVSVPTRKLRLYAFGGMMGQVPLMLLTRKYKSNSWFGNVVFWCSFCIFGQPLMVLLYYHGYQNQIF